MILTHNIPKLMAIPTPIFSANRICKFHRITHGMKDRDTSINAAQTSDSVISGNSIIHCWVNNSLAWNCANSTDGFLLTQVPGRMSMKVLANGLHNTQGMIAVGSAKMDSVMIENQT